MCFRAFCWFVKTIVSTERFSFLEKEAIWLCHPNEDSVGLGNVVIV